MNLNIGTIVVDEHDNHRVVTKVEHGFPVQTESIEVFVAKTFTVEYQGHSCTIQEAIELATQDYVRKADVQRLSSDLTAGS